MIALAPGITDVDEVDGAAREFLSARVERGDVRLVRLPLARHLPVTGSDATTVAVDWHEAVRARSKSSLVRLTHVGPTRQSVETLG
jgi:hypothetical protein